MASSKKLKPKKRAKLTKRIGIALSGGLDSVVLLDAVCKAYPHDTLIALHIHHGLQKQANQWLIFCEKLAQRYQIEFDFRLLHLHDQTGNVEARARTARYDALIDLCEVHDLDHLLLAHHQNDQAETVLLQLLRGAGPSGLSGMGANKELRSATGKRITLWRPLLEQTRAELEAYARRQRLQWVEDPSNQNTRYRRNALRKTILPALSKIQPGAIANLARSAQLLAQTQVLLDRLAQEDAKALMQNGALHIARLIALQANDQASANNVLRYWLKHHQLTMPSQERLQAWWQDLVGTRSDKRLQWMHDGRAIRAWRGLLQVDPLPTQERAKRGEWIFVPVPVNSQQAGLPWDWYQAALHNKTIESKARKGGERLKIKPNTPSKALKNLYQEADVPPWQRDIPLLYINQELIAVEGLGVSQSHLVHQGKRVWPEWT
jgi:tRNA(Ile)-lysidine synthase